MLKLASLFKMEYPPDLLSAIKANRGSEAFYGLIFDKVKKAVGTFIRMSFQDEKPWEIEPAAESDLAPDEVMKIDLQVEEHVEQLKTQVEQAMLKQAQQAIQMGQQIDFSTFAGHAFA